MILTTNNDPSSPYSAETARCLRDECDDVSTFSEGGSHYVVGYKGTTRKVYAHFRDTAHYESYLGLDEPSKDYPSYPRR